MIYYCSLNRFRIQGYCFALILLSFFSQFTGFSKKDFPKVAGSFQYDKVKQGESFVVVFFVLLSPHFKNLRPRGNP